MKIYLPSFAVDLNNEQVSINDLRLAITAVHELPPEERDMEGRMLTLFRIFPNASAQKYQAIYYRLVALSQILASGGLPYFASPECSDGSILMHGIVIQAAASEPLIFSEREAYFDPKNFRDRVLSLAEPDYRA